ncbi:glycosyltransferase [Novosphingobium soli]|uniref:Glycosyltransferase n=1 Tax=Novosphingobium soli TaxID=574956 RepID=A0ABV6CXE0_9SPHN
MPEPGAWHFAMTHSAPGGLIEIWNDVAAGLEARGHRTGRFVLYPDHLLGGEQDARRAGWHHLLDARPRGPGGAVRLMAALVRWLRLTRPSVVVTAMPLANVVVAVAATLARTGTRVVATHHSPIDTHSAAIVRLDTQTGRLPAVAAVVAVSHAVATSLFAKPAGYRAKVRVIHNALPHAVEDLIEMLRGDETGKGEAGEGESGKAVPGRCIAVGRLSHQKNYPLLLRAFARMDAGTLDIVGGGEDEAMLRTMARELGLEGRVRFLGQMSRKDTLAHCSTAQVFVQVSHYEGHSLALIEAARLGLPLVVSHVPVQLEGITNAAGELCGQSVPLTDAPALARVLSALLGDGAARAAWAARSRALGLEASSALMVDRYEALLRDVQA